MKFFVQASLAVALAVCSVAAPASALPAARATHGSIYQILYYYNAFGEIVFTETHYCDGHVQTKGVWDGSAVDLNWVTYDECD